jgi:hypothetical protein
VGIRKAHVAQEFFSRARGPRRVPQPKNNAPYEVSLLPVVMEVLKRRRAEIADNEAELSHLDA